MKRSTMNHGRKKALGEFDGKEDLPGYCTLVTNVSDVILSIMVSSGILEPLSASSRCVFLILSLQICT